MQGDNPHSIGGATSFYSHQNYEDHLNGSFGPNGQMVKGSERRQNEYQAS